MLCALDFVSHSDLVEGAIPGRFFFFDQNIRDRPHMCGVLCSDVRVQDAAVSDTHDLSNMFPPHLSPQVAQPAWTQLNNLGCGVRDNCDYLRSLCSKNQ